MVSPIQVVNGTSPSDVTEIELDYDPTTYAVSVTPSTIQKGSTICFTNPKGKVRVVFISPFNDDGPEMLDSAQRKLTVGGIYHFRCFFKASDYSKEIQSPTGGILDVQPHRP